MNLNSQFAIITNDSYASVQRLSLAHRSYASPALNDRQNIRMMLLVGALHIVAIYLVLHPFAPAPSQQPVLSFTVTMMDISSSQNSISSAASAAAAPAEKPEPQKNVEAITPDTRAAKVKKVVKSEVTPTPRTTAPLSHSSQEQTAVLAPTRPAQFDAAYLNNPAPAYPALSRRMGEQGNILLSVYVNETGQPQNVQLKKSSGFDRLDNAALDAVKRWRFIAAKQQEQLVASWVQVPITFILE